MMGDGCGANRVMEHEVFIPRAILMIGDGAVAKTVGGATDDRGLVGDRRWRHIRFLGRREVPWWS